jgi:Fic family protein
MENFVDNVLRKEISMKLEKIARSPEYYDKRKDLVIENIRSIGDVYSFWIENPDLRKELLSDKKQPKTLKKIARKGIQNVHNAWYFLCKKGEYGNFIDYLDIDLLERTNGLVMGKKRNEIRKRRDIDRNDSVTLNYPHYTPPNPTKVENKIGGSILDIKEINSHDTLESAIKAHIDIAAIQPFMDGNKRTARLIQDRILYDGGLPPAMISAGEAIFYRELLGSALKEYEHGGKQNKKRFYDYCASKVNNGLDEILGDLTEEPGGKLK